MDGGVALFRELRERRFARELVERRVALELVGDAHLLAHPGVERLVGGEQRVLALRLAGLLRELIDRFDDLLDLFVRERDRFEEDFLGDLVRAAFDHHDGIRRAGDDDLHPAGLVLFERRVGDVGAVLVASDADGGDVLVERDVAHGERCAGGADGDDVGIKTRIGREDRRDDLDVVAEAVGK